MVRATASASRRVARRTTTVSGSAPPPPPTRRSTRTPTPPRNRLNRPIAPMPPTDSQWPLWEVFLQPPKGEAHEHAGSVHAVDAEHALQNARDVYARRGEAVRS